MITDFNTFGPIHLMSLLIPVLIIIIFLKMDYKYKDILLAITIVLIRSVRYVFDMFLGEFKLTDLVSLHVCHIALVLLIIALIKPSKRLFNFIYLVGIPTALAVALFPGKIHPEPGLLRAIFFVMSHMMIVMGAIYLQIKNKYIIKKKEIYFYYMFSFIAIVIMYFINKEFGTNYMYLIEAPKATLLESLQNNFQAFYQVSIYLILMALLTILFFVNKLVSNFY